MPDPKQEPTVTELELFKDVTAGQTEVTDYAPPTGEFLIVFIEAEGAYDLNCAIEVKFDSVLVWSSKGSSKMTRAKSFTGDGVKKVELILDATDLPTGSVFLGGYIKIEEPG